MNRAHRRASTGLSADRGQIDAVGEDHELTRLNTTAPRSVSDWDAFYAGRATMERSGDPRSAGARHGRAPLVRELAGNTLHQTDGQPVGCVARPWRCTGSRTL